METTSASGRRTTNSIVCSFVLPVFRPLLPPLQSARVTAALAVTGSNRCQWLSDALQRFLFGFRLLSQHGRIVVSLVLLVLLQPSVLVVFLLFAYPDVATVGTARDAAAPALVQQA